MIYGIGTDLCEVSRIEKRIERDSFFRKIYSAEEQQLINSRKNRARAETAAANFAAKEAFLKACGTGLGGCALNEISALRNEAGAPYFALTGTAKALLAERRLKAHLSLTHEAGLAAAFVILEYKNET